MYSKLTIIGRLGNDPVMRYLPSGQSVTDMSVATNRVYTDSNGQKVTETTWWRISAWGKLAENCNQYLEKGRLVYIEGRMNADQQTGGPKLFTRRDGTVSASYEVTANLVKFLDSMEKTAALDQGGQVVDQDDIPF